MEPMSSSEVHSSDSVDLRLPGILLLLLEEEEDFCFDLLEYLEVLEYLELNVVCEAEENGGISFSFA